MAVAKRRKVGNLLALSLLSLLAQPEFAILRDNAGTGPFQAAPMPNTPAKWASALLLPARAAFTC